MMQSLKMDRRETTEPLKTTNYLKALNTILNSYKSESNCRKHQTKSDTVIIVISYSISKQQIHRVIFQ